MEKAIYIGGALFASTFAFAQDADASFAQKTEDENGYDIHAGTGSASDLSQEQRQDNVTQQENTGVVQQTGVYNMSNASRMSIGDVSCAQPNLMLSANSVGGRQVFSGAINIPLGDDGCSDAMEAVSEIRQIEKEETAVAVCHNLAAQGVEISDSEQYPILAERCAGLNFTGTEVASTNEVREVQEQSQQQAQTVALNTEPAAIPVVVNTNSSTKVVTNNAIPTGENDIVPGGVNSKQELLVRHNNNPRLQALYNRFGITRVDIINARETVISSNERGGRLLSVGRVAYNDASEKEVLISASQSVYVRNLNSWDINQRPSTYRALEGRTQDGKYFAILLKCGNPVVDSSEFVIETAAARPKVRPNRTLIEEMIQASQQRRRDLKTIKYKIDEAGRDNDYLAKK